MTAKKILMVLTSHAELGNTGEKTGFWVEEFAAPYYTFVDAGVEVTLASPKGGQPPIDPKSEMADFQTDSTKRYFNDANARALVANTTPLAQLDAAEFDAVFYPGGHGPLWDLATDTHSIKLINAFLAADKPVGAVCHASAVLMDVKTESGEYLVKDKAVAGFTNSEEAAVGLTDVVPFLLEDELVKRGADFQKVDDWNVFAVRDGLIFTGQNPASSELVAEKMLAYLGQS
ncbi:type 1 glutamine amidotransferase domain-containing protein [Pseudoalteromonas piscicida]|uniref:Type 1 glutamine amidotransferase domain-containing protein n=1 Tax=Pseudoalteromonas piscicida TaxID=43662 RepID=A0A2A5JQM0_PSEO7|nr:type 1 glutamine amidotransferase domain-containing protein [Pseudoalteromonas piscicida]PCK31667.1 type 1 glutamine amidotransferase domain-containing protein [Pseudoalteromonas piscicida]